MYVSDVMCASTLLFSYFVFYVHVHACMYIYLPFGIWMYIYVTYIAHFSMDQSIHCGCP